MPIRIDTPFPAYDLAVDLPDFELCCPNLPLWKRFKRGMDKLHLKELKFNEIPYLVDVLIEAEDVEIIFALKHQCLGGGGLNWVEPLVISYGYEEASERFLRIKESAVLYGELRFFKETSFERFKHCVEEYSLKSAGEKEEQLQIARHYNWLDSRVYYLNRVKEDFAEFEKIFHQVQENQRILGEKVRDINEFGPDYEIVRSAFHILRSVGMEFKVVYDDYTPKVGYELFKKTVLDSIQKEIDDLKAKDPVQLIRLRKERLKAIEAQRQADEAKWQEHLQKMEAERQAFREEMLGAIESKTKDFEENLDVINIRKQLAQLKADTDRMKAEAARHKENYEKCKEKQRLREEQEFSISKFVKELFSKIRLMFESIKVFASIIKLER